MVDKQKLYSVYARTQRTDWVQLNTFETMEEARQLAKEVLNSDSSTEIKIEED